MLVLVAAGVPAALAAGPSVSTATTTIALTIHPGPLSLTVGTPSASTTVVRNDSEHEIDYTLPVTVTDARGTGAGWTLSLQNNGETTTQFAQTMVIQGLTITGSEDSMCPNTISTISAPIVVPVGTGVAPVSVFNAPPDTGMGICTLNLMIVEFGPASAPVNTSSDAFTFALTSGMPIL